MSSLDEYGYAVPIYHCVILLSRRGCISFQTQGKRLIIVFGTKSHFAKNVAVLLA